MGSSRACDRCWLLTECLHRRPLRRPGRPRLGAQIGQRSRTTRQQRLPDSDSPDESAPDVHQSYGETDAEPLGNEGSQSRVGRPLLEPRAPGDLASQLDDDTYAASLLDEVAELGLDPGVARDILLRLFERPGEHAILGLLSELPPELSPSSLLDPSNRQARELAMMLLAAGLQMEIVPMPADLDGRVEFLIDTLRIESLKRIPMLAWKSSSMNVSQSLALLIASYTWSLKTGITEIACRWNTMAGLIWHDLARVSNPDLSQTKALQVALGLLHHEPHTTVASFQPLGGSQQYPTPCREWEFTSPSASTHTDYFTLFSPLIQPLQKVTTAPLEPSAFEEVRDGLEVYFLQFPVSLLEYQSLEFAYQAEAMVWFHGILILTCSPNPAAS
ncbi:hypothetical protein PG997_003400 [Apiospora hydei]|uniref:Uncharacterized protein n=1 Tax=Apiospora hydei TaxID=1337664 RepID=A0ABR1WZ87_9PEZI